MCCGSFPKCEYSPLEGLINYKMLNRQKKKKVMLHQPNGFLKTWQPKSSLLTVYYELI